MRVNPGSAEPLAWSWVHYFCCLHFTSANTPEAVARKGQPSPPTAEYLVICRGQWDKTTQTTASGVLPWTQQFTPLLCTDSTFLVTSVIPWWSAVAAIRPSMGYETTSPRR